MQASAPVHRRQSPSGLEGLPPTKLLYYQDESIREFEAKVLKVVDNFAVLDQTAFYPRAEGRSRDTGELAGAKVTEVTKQADVVVHKIDGKLAEGQVVKGSVNGRRRDLITKHHTATHVINSSARNNLGSWVWQNSAFKDQDYARLDLTHHSALSREEVQRIEQTANGVIRRNLPVSVNFFDRGDAEQKYSFRIYQGGVVPTNNVRIVNVEGWDIEACRRNARPEDRRHRHGKDSKVRAHPGRRRAPRVRGRRGRRQLCSDAGKPAGIDCAGSWLQPGKSGRVAWQGDGRCRGWPRKRCAR